MHGDEMLGAPILAGAAGAADFTLARASTLERRDDVLVSLILHGTRHLGLLAMNTTPI